MDGISAAIGAAIGAFVGAYLRSYLSTKGANLATREDIQPITEIVESVKTQNAILIEATKLKNQLRMAAVDKRLEVHQQAFIWWRQMFEALHTEAAEKTAFESQQWYVQNCLYLEQSARVAFLEAAGALRSHHALLECRTEADAVQKNFDRLMRGGEAILQAVALPGFTDQERQELNTREAAHA
ncbi:MULTISPECIES: hypothetical protein [Duganella]|uniref:Uncharacterized protein n=2 Tax=Duganella TaxID=75654 RepID=A0A7X4H010_9BURK|nr:MULTISPECIES: hypothetical protein [Duganella]MYM72139.1 hypothetical protein [Duganella margarita]MYN30333.1 hypothetical protein [Duganella levis]